MSYFRCGGPHYAAECPDKGDNRTDAVPKVAAFAMGARLESADELQTYANNKMAEDIPGVFLAQHHIEKGQGVIDCVATEAIGGVDALEVLARPQEENALTEAPTVDLEDIPWFNFGNGARQQVMSGVSFGVKALHKLNNFKIYSQEAKGAPILVPITSLAALCAIIDFRRRLAVFTDMDATAVILLEQSETGHLLLDLADDLLNIHIGTLNTQSPFGPVANLGGHSSGPGIGTALFAGELARRGY